jgi:hypothetical protein
MARFNFAAPILIYFSTIFLKRIATKIKRFQICAKLYNLPPFFLAGSLFLRRLKLEVFQIEFTIKMHGAIRKPAHTSLKDLSVILTFIHN